MKIEIIMSAFNNIEMTKIAVESILEFTNVDFSLTIVENNSTEDNSREWVNSLSDKRIKKRLPIENVGGVGARNIGIKDLDKDSKYVVFVDNDIVVTKNWSSRLIDFMEKNKEVGICGPGSNFAGNPQLIEGLNKLDMNQLNVIQERSEEIYKQKYPNFTIAPEAWPVVGFCMFMRKELVDSIGKFDEKLVAGWDDTDYCRRAEKEKWKLAYVNYVYIHHWGHASKGTKNAHGSFYTNKSKKYMLKKWGWI